MTRRDALAGLVLAGLVGTSREGWPAFQASPAGVGSEELRITLRDARLAGAPLSRACQVYVPRFGDLARPANDPKLNRPFAQQCVVRVWNDAGGPKELPFFVHFAVPEDEPLARRVAQVLGRIYWIAREYLSLTAPPSFSDREGTHVWLTREGRPGAEEFKKNIFVYAVNQDRAPAEWLRELAHEYSHIALPAIGPYTAPERWANGYLGERLILKWLIENDQTDAWGTPFSGSAYLDNQVLPLRDRFLSAGPNAAPTQRTGADGMEHLIGFVLGIEAAFGPAVLRDAIAPFRSAPSTQPGTLFGGVAEALRGRTMRGLILDPSLCVPDASNVEVSGKSFLRARRAAYWVFAPSGGLSVRVEGPFVEDLTAALETTLMRAAAPTPAGASLFETRVETAGWRRLTLASRGGRAFEATRITLTSRGLG